MSKPGDITMWDTFLKTFGCSFAPVLIVAALIGSTVLMGHCSALLETKEGS